MKHTIANWNCLFIDEASPATDWRGRDRRAARKYRRQHEPLASNTTKIGDEFCGIAFLQTPHRFEQRPPRSAGLPPFVSDHRPHVDPQGTRNLSLRPDPRAAKLTDALAERHKLPGSSAAKGRLRFGEPRYSGNGSGFGDHFGQCRKCCYPNKYELGDPA